MNFVLTVQRKDCCVRPLFYSDEEYEEYRKETLDVVTRIAEFMGFSKVGISLGLQFSMEMLDKRREKELELHPTYSAD